jgi:hypothetical protein
MSKEKFIYNEHSLQYEKIETTWREQVLRIFGVLSAFAVTFVIVFPLLQRAFPTAEVSVKNAEIQQLSFKYEAMQKHVAVMEKALTGVQQRDHSLYRMMFNVEPLDASVWNGGVGGSDGFTNLARFNSADLILKSQAQLERLNYQLVLQSKSLDTITALAKEKERMLASIPSIKPVREDALSSSIGYLSGFGYRVHPIHKVRKFHNGIDFSAPEGTAIQATGDGEVVQSGRDGGYGNCVIISHGFGYRTLYAHMSRLDVQVGQKVKKGHKIGLIGSTGQSTGAHCHYEVHFNGKIVNPIQFVMDGLSPKEYQALVMAALQEGSSLD